jgi:hypothetical protein
MWYTTQLPFFQEVFALYFGIETYETLKSCVLTALALCHIKQAQTYGKFFIIEAMQEKKTYDKDLIIVEYQTTDHKLTNFLNKIKEDFSHTYDQEPTLLFLYAELALIQIQLRLIFITQNIERQVNLETLLETITDVFHIVNLLQAQLQAKTAMLNQESQSSFLLTETLQKSYELRREIHEKIYFQTTDKKQQAELDQAINQDNQAIHQTTWSTLSLKISAQTIDDTFFESAINAFSEQLSHAEETTSSSRRRTSG